MVSSRGYVAFIEPFHVWRKAYHTAVFEVEGVRFSQVFESYFDASDWLDDKVKEFVDV
jgi:hypothetical protein